MVVPKAERLMRGIFHHRVIYDSKLRDERLNMVKKKKKGKRGAGEYGKAVFLRFSLGGKSFAA